MKRKSIEKTLNCMLHNWFESIKDDSIKELAKQNTIVTGGSIASMLLDEEVNDYDLYFKNKMTALAVAEYYVEKFLKYNNKYSGNITVEDEDETSLTSGRVKIKIKSDGVAKVDDVYFDDDNDLDPNLMHVDVTSAGNEHKKEVKNYTPIFLSNNAIMLSNKIQPIFRFYGTPDKIHETYDFTHCKNYYTSWDRKLITTEKALECLLARTLIYEGSKYPLCSVIRTKKFISRGWRITAGEYLKMLWQTAQLDLTNLDVLEDQLTGVDSAYFDQLIRQLREAVVCGDTIDDLYIAQVVDKVFNEYDPNFK